MNKLLVCSPEDSTREAIKIILADTIDMILCESVEQCLHVIKHTPIKTVLLDLSSQDIEELNRIAALKPSMKIYIIRNQKQKQVVQPPLITGYITKPFTSKEVLAICK